MTLEKLKEEAEKQGYKLIKRNDYDCACYAEYPNKMCRHKNGKWKCIDRYEKIDEYSPKYNHSKVTRCRKKEGR